MKDKNCPLRPQPPRIKGVVDPAAVARAQEALRTKVATAKIKGMAGDEDGAKQLSEALRRLMNSGSE